MDELDRLYRRLVQNIRGMAPDLLTRSFELSQIYQELVPYRTNRRELGFDSNEDYELALMQLVGGLRGYLNADGDLQKLMRNELSSPNPDLASFRVYATSVVSLAPEPLRALEQEIARRGAAIAQNQSGPRPAASDAAAIAARATESFEATPASSPSTRDAAVAPPAPVAAPTAPMPAHRERPIPVTEARDAAPPPSALEPLGRSPRPARESVRDSVHTSADEGGDGCRYCGGTLPDGRKVTFCPHCGHNLTVQHCPACGTECEVEWKYCITCGREVG